jgi:hypothetical protein
MADINLFSEKDLISAFDFLFLHQTTLNFKYQVLQRFVTITMIVYS